MRRVLHGTDRNQRELFHAWRTLGAHVIDCSAVGRIIAGFPDALLAFRGGLRLAEIKGPKGELRPEQEDFHRKLEAHGVVIPVVRTMDDAIALLGGRR